MIMQLQYLHDPFDINEKNFILFCAKHYENTQCYEVEEFYNDLQIPLHLKKLFTRYYVNGDLKEHLILNHSISFFNVFKPSAAVKILFFKTEPKHYSILKTVLYFLNRCPDYVVVDGRYVNIAAIEIDQLVLKQLQRV